MLSQNIPFLSGWSVRPPDPATPETKVWAVERTKIVLFISVHALIKNKCFLCKYWHLSTYGHAKTLLYKWIQKWHIRLRVSQWSCVGHGEAILCLIHDIKLKGTDWVLLSSFWGKRQHPRLSCTYSRKDFSIKTTLCNGGSRALCSITGIKHPPNHRVFFPSKWQKNHHHKGCVWYPVWILVKAKTDGRYFAHDAQGNPSANPGVRSTYCLSILIPLLWAFSS